MTKGNASVSVIVPVFNSEASLPELCQRLETALRGIRSDFEVILVNDGSQDHSWGVIAELSTAHDWIRGINLMRNFGQHNAVLCGLRSAVGKVIVTLDDDLQNPPEEIPKLLARLQEGYDVVYGTPVRQQHGFWRDVASLVTKVALRSSMGAPIAREVSAFRAFRSQVTRAFANYQSTFVSIDVLLTWGTTRFTAVTVQHDIRRVGRSNYTFAKLVAHALNMITGFSVRPLQFASLVGFGFTLFGVGVLIYVVGRYLISGGSVPGFPFLASLISIFSGAQLFALGIIGEYLARMHFRAMDRPPYVVRCVTDQEPDGGDGGESPTRS